VAAREAIFLHGQLQAGSSIPDFARLDQLKDVENRALLSPMNAMKSEGYAPTFDFGFDLSIPVVPLFASPLTKKGD